MQVKKLYKHRLNTDVAYVPVCIDYLPAYDSYVLFGYWMNIVNPKNVFKIENANDEIVIKEEDMKNWEEYGSL